MFIYKYLHIAKTCDFSQIRFILLPITATKPSIIPWKTNKEIETYQKRSIVFARVSSKADFTMCTPLKWLKIEGEIIWSEEIYTKRLTLK